MRDTADYWILDDSSSGGYKISQGTRTIHWCLEWDHCILFVKRRMEEEQFWPKVWRYSRNDDCFFPVTIPA